MRGFNWILILAQVASPMAEAGQMRESRFSEASLKRAFEIQPISRVDNILSDLDSRVEVQELLQTLLTNKSPHPTKHVIHNDFTDSHDDLDDRLGVSKEFIDYVRRMKTPVLKQIFAKLTENAGDENSATRLSGVQYAYLLELLDEWWLSLDLKRRALALQEFINTRNYVYLLGQDKRLREQQLAIRARQQNHYAQEWFQERDHAISAKSFETFHSVDQALKLFRQGPPKFVGWLLPRQQNVRDYVNFHRPLLGSPSYREHSKLPPSPPTYAEIKKSYRSRQNFLKTIEKPMPPTAALQPENSHLGPRDIEVRSKTKSLGPAIDPYFPEIKVAAEQWIAEVLNGDVTYAQKQRLPLWTRDSGTPWLSPYASGLSNWGYLFFKDIGITKANASHRNEVDLSYLFLKPESQVVDGKTTYACVAFSVTAAMEVELNRQHFEGLSPYQTQPDDPNNQLIGLSQDPRENWRLPTHSRQSVVGTPPAEPTNLSQWYASYIANLRRLEFADFANKHMHDNGHEAKKIITAQNIVAQNLANYDAQVAARRAERAENARHDQQLRQNLSAEELQAYNSSLADVEKNMQTLEDLERERLREGFVAATQAAAMADRNRIADLESQWSRYRLQSPLVESIPFKNNLMAEARTKNPEKSEAELEKNLFDMGANTVDLLKSLQLDAIPDLENFPTFAQPERLSDVYGRRFRVGEFRYFSRLQHMSAGDDSLDLDFSFFKIAIDNAMPLTLSFDSDRSYETEDWWHPLPAKGSISHIAVVVGYGHEGLNADTLALEPYLIMRDSMTDEPIHHKVPFRLIQPMILAAGKIISVKVEDQKRGGGGDPQILHSMQFEAEHYEKILNDLKTMPHREFQKTNLPAATIEDLRNQLLNDRPMLLGDKSAMSH